MSRHHPQQWHNVIAKKLIDWEDGPDGGAVLLVPKFRRGPLKRWLQPRLKRPFIRVKLDAIGSFVWRRLMSGENFSRIAEDMKAQFGEKAFQTEERLKRFLMLLYKDKFIELLTPQNPKNS